MPRLNAKAMAEMLNKSAIEQMRILHEQKHPKNQPQVFKTPYYSKVLSTIRAFYRGQRDPAILATGMTTINQIGHKPKRENNARVLSKFGESEQRKRELALQVNEQFVVNLASVEIRLSADMRAFENKKPRVIYYNCHGSNLDPIVARKTLEIGYWILLENKVDLPPRAMEYIDLHAGKVYQIAQASNATIKLVKQNAKIIEALWPTI